MYNAAAVRTVEHRYYYEAAQSSGLELSLCFVLTSCGLLRLVPMFLFLYSNPIDFILPLFRALHEMSTPPPPPSPLHIFCGGVG